ncbi:MAG: hypothetical protein KDK96_01105 [Chlamydiia bacterium]|nr:hypothetical protein [Chlamydiia bacterium]
MKIDFFKIKASSPQRNSHPGFDSYIKSMEALVKETIPESVIEMHETSHFIPIDSSFEKLSRSLPIVQISEESNAPCILSLKVLTREEYSQGLGPFICHMIDEKLLPGKKMTISFLRSLTFKFIVKPKTPYYIIEFFINVESQKDLQAIQKNFPRFQEEIRLTTLGVEHARKLVLAKGYSLEEKRMILLENFTSLIKSSSDFNRKTLFEDVQRVLFKGIYEEYPDKIPDHLLPFIEAKPQTFDHHIFNEIENISILFHEDFSRKRPLSHLSKIISYLYLFRKIITHSMQVKPDSRHLSFKLIPLKIEGIPTLAIILGVNLTEDWESLEETDLLDAIQKCIPNATLVPGSNVINERSKKRVSTLYLEVQKEDKRPFEAETLKLMKKKIPKEIRESLHKSKEEASIPPDETTRSILNLTKEIKSIHDPAKIIIQYHNQSSSHIHFTVILARLQEPEAPPLSLSSSPPITLRKVERKVVGILKKRFIKEVYLYDILIQKEGRSLKEARDRIFSFFKSQLHKLHDFNGGMVTRKYENLALFKSLIDTPPSDTLIENYFYSISPSFMQTLSSADVLKEHFQLILKALNHDFIDSEPLFLFDEKNDQALIVCCSHDERYIEEVKKRARSFSDGIVSTYLKVFDLHILGYMLPKNGQVENFLTLLKQEKLTV